MLTGERTQRSPRDKAVAYCKELIEYHKGCRAKFRNAWYASQAATVILSAATPVLILGNAPKVIQAIPPAIASITGGLAVFRWQENWIIGKSTQEALESELIAFEVGVTELYRQNEEKAVENFVIQINTLHSDHVKEWSNLLLKSKIVDDSSIEDKGDPSSSSVENKA